MALFSFRHSTRTFAEKRKDGAREARLGQTKAHLRYIARPNAARVVEAQRLPGATFAAASQVAEEAARKRKGRVAERFIIALPVEASPEQRVELARGFCEALTQGRAGYVFAIHDQQGNDTANPHAHIVAFDAFERTGGRGRPRSVLGMARKGAVERVAALWADTHNRMMTGWGFGPESAISSLSYAARGIDRVPTIHEGPGARATAQKGGRPRAKAEWAAVDQGHSRAESNAVIREINSIKEADHEQQPHRLGTGNDRHGGERTRSGPPVGAHRGRCGAGDRDAGPPFPAVGRDRRDLTSDGGEDAGGPPIAAPSPRARATTSPPPPFALARSRAGIRHRRGLRRVFRELVMLRDTLRARLWARDRAAKGREPAARIQPPFSALEKARRDLREDAFDR